VGNQQDGRRLLSGADLEGSAVVANCAMNRERRLAGVNSYARELGFNPMDVLAGLTADSGWLDLCCGSGRALVDAAGQLHAMIPSRRATIVGVDLVDAFARPDTPPPGLELICGSVLTYEPGRAFDLITCVHGLHYIGDKLGLLTRAAGWLTDTGCLVADLDLSAIQLTGGPAAMRRLTARLRAGGFAYSARRHQITRTGYRDIHLPYTYLGADDRAGPGYTGQPAVYSHYSEITEGLTG
jgi:SAM-dependent methyltransferase